jgi:probable F420-dependent oxidoreductase
MFPTWYAIRPDDLARAVEDRGFESLWLPEHTHIPASRRTPYPGGGDLPREYWNTFDPFVALTAAAIVTTKLRLATGICLLIERDPIVTAKEAASLDFLSGGRFIFGVGGGWNAEEMENHGTRFKTRWRLLRERVLAMKEIWTNEEAEFHGEFVSFDKVWSNPKPVQKPHPPVIMAGYGPTTFDRVIEYCEGWMPIWGRVPDLPAGVAELRRRAADAGRDPKTIEITIFGAKPDGSVVSQLTDIGIDRVVFYVPSEGSETVLPRLDSYVKLIS